LLEKNSVAENRNVLGSSNESGAHETDTHAPSQQHAAPFGLPLYPQARRAAPALVANLVDHILLFWDRQLFGTATRFLTRIKYVDLQKCYPVELGEALPVVLRPAASQDRCQRGMQGLEELRWAKAQQSSRFLDAGSLGLRSPVRSNSAGNTYLSFVCFNRRH
jgi:hypothetical protein